MIFSFVLFVITLILFIATVGLAMNSEKRVNEMLDKKYIKIVKPMLSIGDIIAINHELDNDKYDLGIVTDVSGELVYYLSEKGFKEQTFIKQIAKIYCSKDLSAEWKARVKRNFDKEMRRVMEEDTE
ncbi:hypothetical protein ACRW9N_13270 [Listeria aquatica]|uniref:hypothetical protein n=1 Tax=Listeria aquatica TaxID=1494960 RepID=UPI003EF836CF